MLDLYAFYAAAAITLLASIFVFMQRKLLYAVTSLIFAFIGSAMVFFAIGQTIVALLQLLVFVGGLSTYLVVAVATEEKGSKTIKIPYFIIITVALFAVLSLFLRYFPANFPNSGTSFLAEAGVAMQTSYAYFYIIAVLLFSTALGGVLIIKKFTKLLV